MVRSTVILQEDNEQAKLNVISLTAIPIQSLDLKRSGKLSIPDPYLLLKFLYGLQSID